MIQAKAQKPREITYELSLVVRIPGVKLPFRLRSTTGNAKLLLARVRKFRHEVSRSLKAAG